MNEESFRQLLVDADGAAAMPAVRADLVSSVRHRLRRRRQSQVAGASIVLCAMLAVVPFVRMGPKPAAMAAADPSKARDELRMIRLQADSQAATINRLMQYQHSLDVRARSARKFDRGQPLERIQQQRESAARLLTQDGDYRRVIELFPETHWASIARRRLQT